MTSFSNFKVASARFADAHPGAAFVCMLTMLIAVTYGLDRLIKGTAAGLSAVLPAAIVIAVLSAVIGMGACLWLLPTISTILRPNASDWSGKSRSTKNAGDRND